MHPQLLAAGPGTPASPSAEGTLITVCGREPGIACRLVWNVTHSVRAADLTKVYFAGPAQLVIRIGYVLLIAVVLRVIAHRAIGKITARAARNGSDATDRNHALLFRERRQQRATALGAILSNAASLTIFGIAAVIIVGDMGLNLAPLLASAGVLGVALGFGAQNLVQDFLAGVFMLIEDQYGVGDVISVGTTTGTVEGVSLRTTRMRDVNGVVWHVRNGTIQQAGNESQSWARAVVDFPVPYHEDIPAVRELMRRTATAMWQEPAWHDILLEEPQVWGVQEVSSDTVLIRVTARTMPLRQWEVQRELTERLKLALDAASVARVDGHAAGPPDDAAAAPAIAPPPSASAPPSASGPERSGQAERSERSEQAGQADQADPAGQTPGEGPGPGGR